MKYKDLNPKKPNRCDFSKCYFWLLTLCSINVLIEWAVWQFSSNIHLSKVVRTNFLCWLIDRLNIRYNIDNVQVWNTSDDIIICHAHPNSSRPMQHLPLWCNCSSNIMQGIEGGFGGLEDLHGLQSVKLHLQRSLHVLGSVSTWSQRWMWSLQSSRSTNMSFWHIPLCWRMYGGV